MQLLKKRGIFIFWILLLLDCYFIYSGNELYRFFTKAPLVPVLLFYIFLNARKNYYHNTKTLVFLALVCSWIGDLLLLGKGDGFFLGGMAAFMLTHILFAITFYRIHRLNIAKSQEAFIAAIVLVAMDIQLYKYISPNLGGFKVPVIIYIVVISIMVIMVSNLLGSNTRKVQAVNFFLPGAALFILSGAALAMRMFVYTDIAFLDIVVMLSYGYAQSLFAEGFTKFLKG